MATARTEHLVETALDLFSRNGFHATGIDRLLAEAGVAKMTLYKHFRSKDALILEALKRRDDRVRRWLPDSVAKRARAPRKRLLAVFDVLDDWFHEPDFRGCLFVHAAAEYGDAEAPAHRAARENKGWLLGYLTELADEAGANDPPGLAYALFLLAEGAVSAAHVMGRTRAAKDARKVAKSLLKTAGV